MRHEQTTERHPLTMDNLEPFEVSIPGLSGLEMISTMTGNAATLTPLQHGVAITWLDGHEGRFPYIWLRDNDPADLHPDTRERLFDLTSVALDIKPDTIELKEAVLTLKWPDKLTPSSYPLSWLRSHRPGAIRDDPALVSKKSWDATTLAQPTPFDAHQCQADPQLLAQALRVLKQDGIILIDGLQDCSEAGERFGDLIGFKRETNFGVMFEVINQPEPNNLAFTALALPLHTDLPNQIHIPGYQFLHCFQNSVDGGESLFADGFRISEALRNTDPAAYQILCSTPVPFRFHDAHSDIRSRRPIIEHNASDQIQAFAFNAHIADIPDLPFEELIEFYAAYQSLMLLMREPKFTINVNLQPGQMVVFDNTRVLHGRRAFASQSTRYLRGYYIENNKVDSRLRVLARNLA